MTNFVISLPVYGYRARREGKFYPGTRMSFYESTGATYSLWFTWDRMMVVVVEVGSGKATVISNYFWCLDTRVT